MIHSYKAVFFDAGGTLLRPYPSVGEIYQTVASRHGCQVDKDVIEKKFRKIWIRRNGLADLSSHSDEKVERELWRSIVS